MKSMVAAKQDEFYPFQVWFPGTFAVVLQKWDEGGMLRAGRCSGVLFDSSVG